MIRDNDRDREEDRQRPHDPISEHLLWLMMNHIRRRQVDNFKQILESRPQSFGGMSFPFYRDRGLHFAVIPSIVCNRAFPSSLQPLFHVHG